MDDNISINNTQERGDLNMRIIDVVYDDDDASDVLGVTVAAELTGVLYPVQFFLGVGWVVGNPLTCDFAKSQFELNQSVWCAWWQNGAPIGVEL
jgi:hypothetical protein